MFVIAALLMVQDWMSTTATGIAFTPFTTARQAAPHRGLKNSESGMMLLEPISRIIDRGYVFNIF